MPGGKLQERRASRFSFFVYMTTRNGFTEKMYRYTSPREKMYRYTSPREKMYRYTSPRRAHWIKPALSSELDKEFYHAMHLAY